MNNEIKINVPEGMEIDREHSTLECIRFKPKKKELPNTWEEFCDVHPRESKEAWIDSDSDIHNITSNTTKRLDSDKNLLPSKEYAEAMLALCQLIQLRDCYNDGWEPDWSDGDVKYVIMRDENKMVCGKRSSTCAVLAFKKQNLRDKFLNNFRDLIEQAKLLL